MSSQGAHNQVALQPIEQAMQRLLSSIEPVTEMLNVRLEHAVGSVLAEDVLSTMDVPPFDNSAMDGYAVKFEDLNTSDNLELVGTSFAGAPFEQHLEHGQCVRIMTGAVMPEGADTVVMQENTAANGDTITITVKPRLGQSVRRCGEELTKGQVVLEKGRQLTSVDVGIMASLGFAKACSIRPLRVAVISTGDELKPLGTELAPGDIYDSNRYAIIALLKKLGVEAIDMGCVPDDREQLMAAFIDADSRADAVITSGGVSVGDADYTKEVLEEIGQIDFWKLAIKPGKPFAFGRLPSSYFFGLPGNPVSSMVTLHQLVVPALQKLRNTPVKEPVTYHAKAKKQFFKRPGRTDYQRAVFSTNEKGELVAEPTGSQGSSMLTSMNKANCYAVLPQNSGSVEIGEPVVIQPFDYLIS
ncbi:molybdopterin molybdotransferase MoeA [Alteromonadaceae bacterium M269]|nr:molybdopterin molybdotransferase MoeA [Alteromonadaceae bacterium M269]